MYSSNVVVLGIFGIVVKPPTCITPVFYNTLSVRIQIHVKASALVSKCPELLVARGHRKLARNVLFYPLDVDNPILRILRSLF